MPISHRKHKIRTHLRRTSSSALFLSRFIYFLANDHKKFGVQQHKKWEENVRSRRHTVPLLLRSADNGLQVIPATPVIVS